MYPALGDRSYPLSHQGSPKSHGFDSISTRNCFNLFQSICLVTELCPILGTPWTAACQAPLSMGFSRQEKWSGLPFRFPRDLPNPGIEPLVPAAFLALQADSLQLSHQGFSLFTGVRKSLCALIMLKNVVFFFVLKVGTHRASYLVISFTIAVDLAHPHVISCQVQRSEM